MMTSRKRGDRKVRVFVVDDHPVVRQGLRQMIEQTDDLDFCGEAAETSEAMAGLAETRPAVAIFDLFLKDGDGIDLIKRSRAQWPDLAILVLTMQEQTFYAERALRAGALGFLNKQEAGDHVLDAIRQVARGEMYVSDAAAPKLLQRLLSKDSDGEEGFLQKLSDRELQVFLQIGRGLGTKEIAENLHLSVKTIETYRSNIREKLDLGTSRDLVKYAIRWSVSQESRT
jgi:DNA-binding NarL/FixJ family response regulator